MRQGQQNRRGRGRSSNRKGGHHNPLSRSFESNGPDVKIRGTPAHIAEKYLSLARDAQSTGDPVLAENYLQHAEHYSRIIMAYREQFNQPGEGGSANGGSPRLRGPGDVGESFDDLGDDGDYGDDGFPQPFMPHGSGHQAGHHGQQPRSQEARQPGGDHGRPDRHDRSDRPERGERQDRPFRRDQGRPRYGERQGFAERERDRQPEARAEQPHEQVAEAVAEPRSEPRAAEPRSEPRAEPRRRDRFQQPHEQPEFLRRPVRRARSSESAAETGKTEPTGE